MDVLKWINRVLTFSLAVLGVFLKPCEPDNVYPPIFKGLVLTFNFHFLVQVYLHCNKYFIESDIEVEKVDRTPLLLVHLKNLKEDTENMPLDTDVNQTAHDRDLLLENTHFPV